MSAVITRRHLPHWYVSGAAHFVTYRIFGTIPRSVMADLQARQELQLRQAAASKLSSREHISRIHKQTFAAYDTFLDSNSQINWLRRENVATVIRENLHHHRGRKYQLFSYCIMPNHVHLLIQPIDADSPIESRANDSHASSPNESWIERPDKHGPLSGIMHSLTSFTANKINRLLERSGQFWQHESYDHWVRDDEELERIVAYIAANPVKAGLVTRPEEWRWSSAYDQYAVNGDGSGWLNQRV